MEAGFSLPLSLVGFVNLYPHSVWVSRLVGTHSKSGKIISSAYVTEKSQRHKFSLIILQVDIFEPKKISVLSSCFVMRSVDKISDF